MKSNKHLNTIIIIAAIAFLSLIQIGFNSYLFLSVKKDLAEIKYAISEQNPEKEEEKEREPGREEKSSGDFFVCF